MGFWNQFDKFDPLVGDIPYYPYFEATDIASRARHLLRDRSSEQVRALASEASLLIDRYFEEAKEEALERLAEEQNEEFLEFERDGEEVRWKLRPNKESELEIPTAENTSEVDALRESIHWCGCGDVDELPDPKEYEYFAAMALWYVGDYISYRAWRYDFSRRDYVERDPNSLDAHDCRVLGEYLIKAMESVGYAEQLRNDEYWKMRLTRRIEESKSSQKTTGEDALKAAREELEAQMRQEDARRRSERARELSQRRHSDTYEAKRLVQEDWSKNRTQFRSAEQAGLHYADWLEQKGYQFQPRTITGWIREHAKLKSIKLR
jgi:hypothetical protein